MGDRRPSISFRFWSSGTRQQPAGQTTAAPSTTTNAAPTVAPRAEPRSVNRSTTRTTNAASTSTRKAENKTPGRQSTSSTQNPSSTSPTTEKKTLGSQSTSSITNSTSTTPPTPENKTPASQLTSNATNSTSSTFEDKTSDGLKTPPKAENKTPDSQPITNTTNPPSMTSPTTENKTPNGQSNSNTTNPTSAAPPTFEKKTLDNPAIPSMKEGQIADKQDSIVPTQITPASTEVQTSKPAATTFPSPTKQLKASSPSHASTQSPSSLKPVAPSRRTTQSRSPPQPSFPYSTTPQARSMPSSPSHMGSQTPYIPQRTPHRVGSHTPKHTSSTNPSKESRRTTQETPTSYQAPTSISQQEPRLKSDDDDQAMDGTSSKHNEVEVMPSKSSQLGTTTARYTDSSTNNGGHEPIIVLNAKPEETKDVKEVVQATNTKANEDAEKEVDDLLTPKSGSKAQITEKAKIPSIPEMHIKKQATKEQPTDTMSQSKKRSTIPNNHNKSGLPTGEHITSHKDVRDDISAFVNRMGIGDLKSAIYDKPVSIITVAGENRGASMQIGSNSSKTEGPVHIHRSYKINPDENVEATTDGEGSSKGKRSEDAKATKDQPPEAYVNNNAQGINNSIVFNSSITERNPGVHMVVTHVPQEPFQSTDKASSFDRGKPEFSMTRIDKLTHEPTVRRRCLRGLLLETSDSDSENPKKPRRHGCRVR